MDIKQTYREEKGIEPYTETPNHEDHFSNEYVKWLEDKINAQSKVNVTLGSVSKSEFRGDEVWLKAQETSRENFEDWFE